MENKKQCPLCSREITSESYADEHHLIPKSLGGKETVTLHRICHSKIHSIFTERELKSSYYTIKLLKQNEEIIKFIKWIKNKSPEFHMKTKTSNNKRKRK